MPTYMSHERVNVSLDMVLQNLYVCHENKQIVLKQHLQLF